MTGYKSKKLLSQSRENDLVRNAIGYLISEGWDEEAVAVREAADRIEQLEAALKQIAFDWHSEDTFTELDVCIEVARSALREKKDG